MDVYEAVLTLHELQVSDLQKIAQVIFLKRSLKHSVTYWNVVNDIHTQPWPKANLKDAGEQVNSVVADAEQEFVLTQLLRKVSSENLSNIFSFNVLGHLQTLLT